MSDNHLPVKCPSCQEQLHVTNLVCNACNTQIQGNYVLPAILKLSREEQQLMFEFVKNNGSPQRLSAKYNLSYPAIRARLDKLISKVKTI